MLDQLDDELRECDIWHRGCGLPDCSCSCGSSNRCHSSHCHSGCGSFGSCLTEVEDVDPEVKLAETLVHLNKAADIIGKAISLA